MSARASAADRLTVVWKTRVPYRYQTMVLETRLAARRANRSRRLPDFLVIGAMRGGTSSLYKYLGAHPSIIASLRKETQYFTYNHLKGEAWYRSHFPSGRAKGKLTFEATPSYLFHPLAPHRAAQLVPDAKLIVLLRNPIDRAFSHYQHSVRRGRETLAFEEALECEASRLAIEEARLAADPLYSGLDHSNFSYLARGRYAEQLERWMQFYPPDRWLILASEDLYVDPGGTYDEVVKFLGLLPGRPRAFVNHSYPSGPPERATMAPSTRQQLVEEFTAHNERLFALLNRRFDW